MTLMDAPKYDVAGAVLRRRIVFGLVFGIGFLFLGWWFYCGTPKDWPNTWYTHRKGTIAVSRFMHAVESNQMEEAYGIWLNDPKWKTDGNEPLNYEYKKFLKDWGPNGEENDFGVIHSHEIAGQRVYGNVLVLGLLINERKSGAVFLAYDPESGQLGFSSVELYLGP